ncbi:MAG TPA: hypothetical protein VKT83_03975 [bacterium]|nr:hypothetical protein [bacterium]
MAGRPTGQHVLAFALYSCFALILFFPILSHPATAYIGGERGPAAQDPLSFMWFLAWIPYALAHHLNPLLTNWIFSDSGANLAWNTAVPFVGLVMSPVTVSAGPILSYNLALILSLIVSAWSAYFAAVRVFGCGFLPALLAGAVYGFSPFQTAHAVGHLHMTTAFTPPLFLLVLHDVLIAQRRPAWNNGAKLAALALIQYFISAEVLLMECVFAAIGTLVLLVACRHAVTSQRVRYVLRSLTLAFLIAFPVLSYPLYLTFLGRWQPSHPVHGVADFYAANLLSFILPTSPQAIFGSLFLSASFTGGEWNTYVGIPLIVLLAVIGRTKRGDATVRFLLTLLIAIVICSLGPSLHIAGNRSTGIPLPWRLFQVVPFFRDIAANRFGEYLYLPLGFVLALYIADRSVPRHQRVLRAVASLAALAFLFPRIPLYPATSLDVPDFFRRPRDAQAIESPALIVPFSTDIAADHASAMLWQAEARMAFKMPEGYAFGEGRAPWPAPTSLSRALIEIEDVGRVPTLTPALRADVIAVLERQRIRTVLLGPSPHEREALAFLVEALGWVPDSVDGVFVWRQVDRRIAVRAP